METCSLMYRVQSCLKKSLRLGGGGGGSFCQLMGNSRVWRGVPFGGVGDLVGRGESIFIRGVGDCVRGRGVWESCLGVLIE